MCYITIKMLRSLVVGSVNTLHIHALLTAANLFASATLK